MTNASIRFATPADTALILGFIRQLADYEHMLDLVSATEEILHDNLFVRKGAEAIFVEEDGMPVGFALFFHNFSTFLGKRGIYLEDLFVLPEKRGKGYGKALFSFLANLACERDCGRLEWACLDWNAPSIAFYKSLGAVPMDDWTTYRLTGDALSRLANDRAST